MNESILHGRDEYTIERISKETKFDFSNTSLNSLALHTIVSKASHLSFLDISRSLVRELPHWTLLLNLEHLNISNCIPFNKNCEMLLHLLKSPRCKLKTLVVGDDFVWPSNDKIWIFVGNILTSQEINLQECIVVSPCSDKKAALLCKLMEKSTCVVSINGPDSSMIEVSKYKARINWERKNNSGVVGMVNESVANSLFTQFDDAE